MNKTPLHHNSYQTNPVIFSFGQQHIQPYSPQPSQLLHDLPSGNKHKFILKLIDKYELKSLTSFQSPRTDSRKIPSKGCDNLQNCKTLTVSTNQQKHDTSVISLFEETKREESVISMFRCEIEQSHQRILDKYLTPGREEKKLFNQNYTENQTTALQNTISQIVDQVEDAKDEFENQNQTSSIPLVESLLLDDREEAKGDWIEIRELEMREENQRRDQRESDRKDELQIAHILGFCLVILIVLLVVI